MATKAECCIEETRVSKIKLDDKGSERTVTILNPERTKHVKARVDGCLVKQETAADWLLSKPGVGHLVVELKGCDVDHAVEQVLETAKLAKEKAVTGEGIAALISCARYPRVDTKVQRGKQKFSKNFNGPLYVISKSAELTFEHVLGDKGPYGV